VQPYAAFPIPAVGFLQYHRRVRKLHPVLAVLAFVAVAVRVDAALPEPVRTDAGLVSGVPGASPAVWVFKGLPFAAPPVGDRRWRPPESPAKWEGVRKADTFGANCMQRRADGGAFPPYAGERTATRMSEDCLYLNVYTAAASASARQPVMVWIHGGAWTSGSGPIYDGEDLARKGVVYVSVNYRLGIFGFFAHPGLTSESAHHSSGNYALLDQIAALQWVQRNIAAFGGDPTRVTIFGESAGSWSVHNLVGSPLAKGLFQRAIGESGGRFSITATLAEAEQEGVRYAESVGAKSIADLRAKPADVLNDAREGIAPGRVSVVDGWVLPATMWELFSGGRQNDVPMLIGSNSDEGSIFTPESVTAAAFRQQTERRYNGEATALLVAYPFTSDKEARLAQAHSMRDQTFGWEMRTWARLQAKTGKSKIYLYYFSHVPPMPNASWLGAQHGSEIPYALNWPNGAYSTHVSWTDADRKLADSVSTYWVNFATSGDPNGKGVPAWPAFDPKSERALTIGDTVTVTPVPNAAALDVWDGVLTKRLTKR
jgi:para-nitrobenzyl esterase